MMNAPDLAALIADAKGDRSYDQISRAAGGKPTAERLQQLATGEMKTFPGPATIEALARGLGVTVTDVVSAACRSLGIEVHYGATPGALTIPGAGALPAPARRAIEDVAQQMLALHQAAEPREDVMGNAEHPAPIGAAPIGVVSTSVTPPQTRPVAASRTPDEEPPRAGRRGSGRRAGR
ncbi:hypothetical protein [Cellulomonas sp. KH9]|uniref:hypothetical protein n=1 Tax=Cellulomonas sp. KH9 TaxID=1855324 RepID=UPI001160DF9C|nr:hypothetical protein [Cellulomonas sp. KH9]